MVSKTGRVLSLASLLSLALVATSVQADELTEAREALQRELPGTLLHNPYLIDWVKTGKDVSTSRAESPGVPGNQAYRVRVKKAQEKSWQANIRTNLDRPIKKGDKIKAFFWVRTEKSGAANGLGDVQVSLGRNREPYDVVFSQSFEPSTQWKLLSVDGVAKNDFPVDEVQFGFNLGNARQTIEFGQYYILRSDDTVAQVPAAAPATTPAASPASNSAGKGPISSPASLQLIGPGATARRLPDSARPSSETLEVTVTQPSANAWTTFVNSPLRTSVGQGQAINLSFWARSVDGPAKLTAVVKQNSPPYSNAIRKEFEIGDVWQEYTVNGAAKVDVPQGNGAISFMLGDRKQTIQFGEYQVSVAGG